MLSEWLKRDYRSLSDTKSTQNGDPSLGAGLPLSTRQTSPALAARPRTELLDNGSLSLQASVCACYMSGILAEDEPNNIVHTGQRASHCKRGFCLTDATCLHAPTYTCSRLFACCRLFADSRDVFFLRRWEGEFQTNGCPLSHVNPIFRRLISSAKMNAQDQVPFCPFHALRPLQTIL